MGRQTRKKNTKTLKSIIAKIDLSAVYKNYEYLKREAGTEIIPVLKGDAYGHGLTQIAAFLRKKGVPFLSVATAGEALELRNAGDKGRLLCWLYDVKNPGIEQVLDTVDIGLFDESHIEELSRRIPKGKKCCVHLFVDTGINRAGIPYENAIRAAEKISNHPKFSLVGLMSHFVESEIKNDRVTDEQLSKFRKLRNDLEQIHITPEYIHIANSGGILNYDVSDFTHSRAGCALFGLSPMGKIYKDLTPVMTVVSPIIQLKNVRKGDTIGYDATFKVPYTMRIAIVPIGYADGLPRSSSGKLYVTVGSERRRVLGLLNMDQIIVKAHSYDKVGDEVTVFSSNINIYDIANAAATIPSEIMSKIGSRVKRVYY